MTHRFYIEFIKYGMVGLSGILVNLFFLYVLTEFGKIYYLYSEILAFFVATLSNFILNKIWTFNENLTENFLIKGGKFFLISAAALLINLFFLFFFTEIIKIYYIISQVLASAFTFITNYFGNKFWTFNRKSA